MKVVNFESRAKLTLEDRLKIFYIRSGERFRALSRWFIRLSILNQSEIDSFALWFVLFSDCL